MRVGQALVLAQAGRLVVAEAHARDDLAVDDLAATPPTARR